MNRYLAYLILLNAFSPINFWQTHARARFGGRVKNPHGQIVPEIE